jgi:peptidoglycan/LPS O-acetylase OafA/YrhL
MDGSSSGTYRPWLDGVRAIAIGMVVVEHVGLAGDTRLALGGTGVGIFFALSGYLITGLLLTEIDRSGDIGLRRFYVRRFARLMPALVALILVCDALYLSLGAMAEVKSSALALTYLTNYGTILRGHHLPGYGHTWSLAVEEHFYVLWPLMLLAMTRRLSLRQTLWATLAICIAVLLWRVFLSTLLTNPRMLYVGSIERADALLYGCCGAMLVKLGWRPPRILFYVGATLVLIVILRVFPLSIVNSAILAIATTLVLVTLDHCTLPVKRLLSLRPVVWLGVMSYGIYLWHSPLLDIARKLELTDLQARLGVVVLAVVVAAVSHKYLETPIRNFVRSRERPSVPVAAPSLLQPSLAPAQGSGELNR